MDGGSVLGLLNAGRFRVLGSWVDSPQEHHQLHDQKLYGLRHSVAVLLGLWFCIDVGNF